MPSGEEERGGEERGGARLHRSVPGELSRAVTAKGDPLCTSPRRGFAYSTSYDSLTLAEAGKMPLSCPLVLPPSCGNPERRSSGTSREGSG